MLKITIEKDNLPDSFFQSYLHVFDTKVRIGIGFFFHSDCVSQVENLVREFSKEGILVDHSQIYKLN